MEGRKISFWVYYPKRSKMTRFGPSGNDELFYQQGFKSTVQAPAWVRALGLSAFEYSFGRGIKMSDATAESIGREAKKNDIALSAHAPYFINLGSSDPTAIAKSYGYIERSLKLLRLMGGNRLVVHLGSQGELSRAQAIENIKRNLKWVISELDKNGFSDFLLCIETMGRPKQIGTYQEICELCSIDRRVIPTLDFGHINCTLQGGLRQESMFKKVVDYCIEHIGLQKMKQVHIHFSAIKFTEHGEREHTILSDSKFSIPFVPLARLIKEYKLEPVIICESAEIMAQDAVRLLKQFNSI